MNIETNIDALHDAIVADLTAAFPGLHIEFYREDRSKIPAPSLLLQLTDFDVAPDEDPGTQQLALQARFEADLVLGFREPKVRQKARTQAAAIANWIHNKSRWTGVPTGHAIITSIGRDEFSIDLDQYEVWKIEWSQTVYIGPSIFDQGPIFQPTEVLSSFSPEIGAAHESTYKPMSE